MNGSRSASLTLSWRFAALRVGGFPLIPVAILAGLLLLAIFAEVLAPHDPEVGALGDRFRPPAWLAGGSDRYLLGTDHLGRDVLSRLIFGARVSVVVGFTAVIVAGVLGTGLGILAGYLGGWVDQVIMRITDTWLALPALTFAIFLAAIVGPSETNIVIILAAVYWTRYARVIRGEVLSIKQRDFVRLAIVAGCSKRTIMRRHVLPNVVNSAVVLGTLMLGVVIVTEATLSFLGAGVPPPKPAWGLMLADGKKGLGEAVANYLGAVGIRARVRTMERATFLTEWREKKLKGVILGIAGAAGNAATRLEAYVTRNGIYAYGVIPEVEDLFQQQAREMDRKKREALLGQIQQIIHDRVTHVPVYELGFLWGVGPRVEEAGVDRIKGFAYTGPYEDLRLRK